jgi:hypothetical protein
MFFLAFCAHSSRARADDEVTVRGSRREAGQSTMSARDVREMPGAFGDRSARSRLCRA